MIQRLRAGRAPVRHYIVQPTLAFLRLEAASGFALVAAAATALLWANLDPASYADVWTTRLVLDLDILRIDKPAEKWVNDALMVVFFFVVGLEIKREAVLGELADRRQALLPAAAAIGGMVVPVLIFVAVTSGGPGAGAWGIPVATDIAFALGVLALLGPRVPVRLKIFLLGVAVVDDIGGILIIAIFYTDEISMGWLAASAGLFVLIALMNRAGIRPIPAYLVVGAVFWLATFESGVHATLAGVILGLLTPVRPLYDPRTLRDRVLLGVSDLQDAHSQPDAHEREGRAEEAIARIEKHSRESRSPLVRLEHAAAPWAAFAVIPIFALANAGIELTADTVEEALGSRLSWGIVGGLLGGKTIGILAACVLLVRLRLVVLPGSWTQVVGVSLLAGIGFTVSIFIAGLALDDPRLVQEAKTGILFASIVAAILGYTVVRLGSRPTAAE